MKHSFRGPRYTVGVEEELMIVDAASHDLVNAVEKLMRADDEHVKPELMEPVLEIATDPCPDVATARAQLVELRRRVGARAARHGLAIGSAGTHPWALWEDQRIVARERYQSLADALGFVVRQELLFGLHVHVGLDDPELAIAVANGLRVKVPLLLALSANSPYWRGIDTGLMSARAPIFRSMPRVGIPPYYADWADYQRRIEFMVSSGLIEDYTFLWFDVRPHPDLGTVEVRAMDGQTRVEDTLALAALIVAAVHDLCERADGGAEPPRDQASELLDENKWLAVRYGLDAELVELPGGERTTARDMARRELAELREHAEQLRCADALGHIGELLDAGSGADRQRAAHERHGDLAGVMAQIVAETGASWTGRQ